MLLDLFHLHKTKHCDLFVVDFMVNLNLGEPQNENALNVFQSTSTDIARELRCDEQLNSINVSTGRTSKVMHDL